MQKKMRNYKLSDLILCAIIKIITRMCGIKMTGIKK